MVAAVKNVSDEIDNVIKGYNMKNQIKTEIHKMIKIAMGVFTVALFIHITTIGTYAYTQTTGTVIPATAKIRAEASTSSETVGSTAAGKTLTITDEVSGSDGSTWYQVEVDGSTKGYIRSDLVTKAASSDSSGDTALASNTATASVTQTDSQAAIVSTASANVRKSASTTAEVVSSVAKGSSVTITGKTTGDDGKDWYQISYNNGASTGFIRADLVSIGAVGEKEVIGTKSSATDTSKKEEPEASSEAPTEEANTEEANTEAATEENTGEETEEKTSSTGAVTVMNTEETPVLPSGFQEVAVTLNDQNVRAWKNGDFYIFFGQAADGTEGFYMYDSVEASYQRYFMSNIEMPEEKNSIDATGILKPVVIAMAVVLVILLIIILILTMKLNEYKEELGWDSDEDEDDYPEDDIEEEEEEEELPRPRKKKKRIVKPVIEEDDDIMEEEPEPVVRRVPKKKVSSANPQVKKITASKPRNFLEVDEEMETPVKRKVKKKPTFTPVKDDLDPDDEDTFVFINLDGDDLD